MDIIVEWSRLCASSGSDGTCGTQRNGHYAVYGRGQADAALHRQYHEDQWLRRPGVDAAAEED